MFRISIEEFGSTAGVAGPLGFVLAGTGARSARQVIHESVAREIELRGLSASPAVVAARQAEAIAGFGRGTFTMLAGGVPVADLEQLITADDEVLFIRVLPMVGG